MKNVRREPIEKSYTPKTVKTLVKNKGKLKFDLTIQRGNAWNVQQRSLFIHSLIYGFPFPPLYAHDNGDGNYWMLDGKQRLTAVIDFIEGKYTLHKDTPTVWGEPIAGKGFDNLSEDMKDEIYSTNFVIYQLKGMDEDERDEMFVRLNGGTALSKLEVTRAVYSEFFESLKKITNHEFFLDSIGLSETALNKFVDEELAVQMLLIEERKWKKGIGSNSIREYIEEVKEAGQIITDEYAEKFNKVLNYLVMAVSDLSPKERRQIFKKGNVPIVYNTAKNSMIQEMDHNDFGERIRAFFNEDYDPEGGYSEALKSGSAKPSNVSTRMSILNTVVKN